VYHCLAFKWCVNRLNDHLGEQCFGDQLLKETMDPQVKYQTNSELNRNNEGLDYSFSITFFLITPATNAMQCNQFSSFTHCPRTMLLSYKGIIQDRQSQDFCLFTSFATRMLLFLSAIPQLITSSIPSVVVNKEVLKYSFSTKLHKHLSKRDIKWRCIDMVTASLRMCTYA